MTIDDVAERTAKRMYPTDAAIDVGVIVLIAELIAQMVELIQDRCVDPADPGSGFEVVTKPTRWQERILHIRVRSELRWSGPGWRDDARDISTALLAEAKSLKENDVKELLAS